MSCLISFYWSWFVAGFSNICCKFGNQPCNWRLSWASVWGQLGGGPGYSDSSARYLFYPCCCAGVITWEDAARIMGSAHFLGTGWPLCSKFMLFHSLWQKNECVIQRSINVLLWMFLWGKHRDGFLKIFWNTFQNTFGEDENKLGGKKDN